MTMKFWVQAFGAVLLVVYSSAIPIDNGVENTTVICNEDSITVNFRTQNPFGGRIFVKGMSDKEDCISSHTDGDLDQEPTVTFSFGDCNMQRSRTLSPQQGMMQSIVVIISFHRIFITKVDKAFRVQCFYMEAEKSVSTGLDVSMITTEDVGDNGRMPTCVYSVRGGSKDGEVIRFAVVGDEVYHEWECDSDSHRLLVKSCFVDDGQGNKQELLDERGCAIDPVILADLTYEEPEGVAKAWVEAHVFKYADRPTVSFQCTIQLCNKGDPTCDAISPPKCRGGNGNGLPPGTVTQRQTDVVINGGGGTTIGGISTVSGPGSTAAGQTETSPVIFPTGDGIQETSLFPGFETGASELTELTLDTSTDFISELTDQFSSTSTSPFTPNIEVTSILINDSAGEAINPQERRRVRQRSQFKRIRQQRSIRENDRNVDGEQFQELDLFSNEIAVLDLSEVPDNPAAIKDYDSGGFPMGDFMPVLVQKNSVCLSPIEFGTLVGTVILFSLIAFSVTAVVCYSRSQNPHPKAFSF